VREAKEDGEKEERTAWAWVHLLFEKPKETMQNNLNERKSTGEKESTAIYLIHKNADENKKRGAFRPLDTQNIRYII